LALLAAEAVGGAAARGIALRPGCAIELIHAYSLVHDDLPAMDDDAMRRGRPAVHARFGEAVGILTGDALLTEAFAALSGSGASVRTLDAGRRALAIVGEVARAAGAEGMVAGQVGDLASEGRDRVSLAVVRRIHERKTGALIRASVRVGAISAGASAAQMARLSAYGDALGLAFQITDDILDETADAARLGKPGGGDRARKKATYPAALGLDGARRAARRAEQKGRAALAAFGRRARALEVLLDRVVERAA
jgi:geranylgeranyl diphosphate synthase type II